MHSEHKLADNEQLSQRVIELKEALIKGLWEWANSILSKAQKSSRQ
jgi:hypothetical protein